MQEGHRQRMLQRLEHEEDLQDHELLEILLFNAIPRKNTNPLAHELLLEFPSLKELFCADFGELLDVRGIGRETAAYLRCIAEIYARVGREREELPALFSAGEFSLFLRRRYEALSAEVLEIFSIDAQQHIHSCKRFSERLSDRVQLETGEIADFFAARRPAGIVLAHNHPAAPAHPSREDDGFTAQMQIYCSMNGIRLYDHIIVGQDGTYSYFLVGRMEEIRRKFDIAALVGEKLYRG